MLMINRKENLAIIVLSNTHNARVVGQFAGQLMRQATGKGLVKAKAQNNLKIDAAHRARLVGRYELSPDFIFDVKDRDGHLTVRATNQSTLEIIPESATHWSCEEVKATIEFKLGNKGPAKSLVLHQGGIKQTAKRMEEKSVADDKSAKEAPEISAEDRARLVGRYELAPNFIFDVQDQDGRLMVGATNQPTLEVLPDSATHWTNNAIKATLEFKLGNKGPAKSLVLHQNGAKQTAKRMEEKAVAVDKSAEEDIEIDGELRARLVGRYKLNQNFIFDVKDHDGHLMVGITNQPTQEVYPDSATRWSYKGLDATLEFKLRKKGTAKSLVLHQNGIRQTAKRMGR